MPLFSPALDGDKLDVHALEKLERLRKLIPQELFGQSGGWLAFMDVLTAASILGKMPIWRAISEWNGVPPTPSRNWRPTRKKLESQLKSAKMQKPSHVYFALEAASGDLILHLLYTSQQRIVQDRIRNYLQKYLPAAQEAAVDVAPGKARTEAITKKLNARPKKPPVEIVEAQPEPPGSAGAGRRDDLDGKGRITGSRETQAEACVTGAARRE